MIDNLSLKKSILRSSKKKLSLIRIKILLNRCLLESPLKGPLLNEKKVSKEKKMFKEKLVKLRKKGRLRVKTKKIVVKKRILRRG